MTLARTTGTTALLALLAFADVARAYSVADRFALAAAAGGGGGRRFTGSPADGFTCAVCHDREGAAVELTGFPTTGYDPGETYSIDLTWPDDAAAVAFALEVVTGDGAPAGTLALPPADALEPADRCAPGDVDPPPPAVQIYPTADGRAVAGADACGARRGRLHWTAPDVVAGPVWLHASAVVANASGDASGDATRSFLLSSPVTGSPPPEAGVVEAGCGVAPGRGGTHPIATLLFGAAVYARARRRRHGR